MLTLWNKIQRIVKGLNGQERLNFFSMLTAGVDDLRAKNLKLKFLYKNVIKFQVFPSPDKSLSSNCRHTMIQ